MNPDAHDMMGGIVFEDILVAKLKDLDHAPPYGLDNSERWCRLPKNTWLCVSCYSIDIAEDEVTRWARSDTVYGVSLKGAF